MQITSKTSFHDFMTFCSTGLVSEQHIAQLTSRPRPAHLCGVMLPANLNSATLLQLSKMRDMPQDIEGVFYLIETFLSLPRKRVIKEPAASVLAVAGWIMGELDKIARAFDRIKTSYTAEEIRAGVKRLDFGYYGMADSYALRMGITDPDVVMETTPWLKIYHAMKKDNEIDAYQRRLRNEYKKKTKK